jgi:hypothetical protein
MASTTAKLRNRIYKGFRDELQGDIAPLENAAHLIARWYPSPSAKKRYVPCRVLLETGTISSNIVGMRLYCRVLRRKKSWHSGPIHG